jgi:tRNA wybutosine-synthesizing protein 1
MPPFSLLKKHSKRKREFLVDTRIILGLMQKDMMKKTSAHVAISLAGEPTLYPEIGSLISEFKKRGLTTFLVTNGTCPETLSNMNTEPSQLFISVCAPNKEIFVDICRPNVPRAWEKLMQSLSLLNSFSCPTVM